MKLLKERNGKVMGLVLGGSSYSEVAAALGMTRSAVAGVVNRNRVSLPCHKKACASRGIYTVLITDGEDIGTVSELAEKHRVTVILARSRADKGNKGWSVIHA